MRRGSSALQYAELEEIDMEETEESAGASSPGKAPSTVLALAWRLRHLLCLMGLEIVQYVIATASAQYIMITFFAQNHGGGDCEVTPSSDSCRKGAADLAFYMGLSAGLSRGVAWISTLGLGVWSDHFGRRPLLRAAALVSVLPTVSFAGYVFFGVSLWVFLVMSPLADCVDTAAVMFASLTDLIPEPHMRAAAFGVLMATVILMVALVLPFAGLLAPHLTVAVSVVACFVRLAYVWCILPETMVTGQTDSQRPSRAPGLCSILRQAMQVVTLNSFTTNMVILLSLSGLANAGFGASMSPYMTGYMGITRAQGAFMFLLAGALAVTFLGLAMKPLVARIGEINALRLSSAFSAAFGLLVPLCQQVWIFMALCILCIGPIVLQFPIITAIKSNLVGEDKQGIVQGTLSAFRVLSVAIGHAFFGWFYRLCTDGGAAPNKSAAFPPILLAASLAILAFAQACSLPEEIPLPADAKHLEEDEDIESSEDNLHEDITSKEENTNQPSTSHVQNK